MYVQNTQGIKRTLLNWTKQDKTCKFSRKSSFSSYVNLLCVLDVFFRTLAVNSVYDFEGKMKKQECVSVVELWSEFLKLPWLSSGSRHGQDMAEASLGFFLVDVLPHLSVGNYVTDKTAAVVVII